MARHASLKNDLLGIRRRGRADPARGNVCASLARKQALISALLLAIGANGDENLLSDLGKTLDGNRFGISFAPQGQG